MFDQKPEIKIKCFRDHNKAGPRVIILSVIVLLIFILTFSASARESVDITKRCRISFPGNAKARVSMMDGKYSTYWSRSDSRMYEMKVTLPAGIDEGGLYFQFYDEPEKLVVLNEEGEIHRDEGKGFAHRYIPFTSKGQLIIQLWGAKKGFSLSEFSVLSEKEPPEWVQTWQPTPEKADLMIVVRTRMTSFCGQAAPSPITRWKRTRRSWFAT